jgi:hypothetical protein
MASGAGTSPPRYIKVGVKGTRMLLLRPQYVLGFVAEQSRVDGARACD